MLLAAGLLVPQPVLAASYYSPQTNFTEDTVPLASYAWEKRSIRGCIYKDAEVPNSYYIWTKLAVQEWRQAMREFTGNTDDWAISARYASTKEGLEACDLKIYIFKDYKFFPDYPRQTGAYTSVKSSDGNLDARVYLSPTVLHGDGRTELDLPSYAFRNSAIHEIGHVLGLAHMKSQKGYLMSPQFDFQQERREYPITDLELRAIVDIYGADGFQP